MTDQKTNLKYILIVVILAVIVGGGILVYWWQIKKEEIKPPELVTHKEIEDEGLELEPLNTASWQTYQNEKYGFEFRYPAEFYIKQSEEKVQDLFYIYNYPLGCGSSCQTLDIAIKFGTAENESLLPISEWVNQNVDIAGLKTDDKPMIVDGTEGLKRIYKDADNRTIAVFIFFPHKNNKLNIVYHFETTGSYNIQILEEIISTFHFLN